MKKKLLLIPALALLIASCSSEEPIGDNNPNAEYAAATSYLNVNLLPATGMGPMGIKGTRADVENPYEQGDGTYEDGSPNENNVTSVRFYFFGSGGAPCAVRQNLTTGEYDNFVDWYPNSSEVGGPNHDKETVEKTLTATLGLTFKDNDEKPEQVLAVANPTTEILYYSRPEGEKIEGMSSNCMSLGDLQAVVANYQPYTDNNFVMSNSVYVNNGKAVYTTTLDKEKNFKPTPAAAAEAPVTIYIERVLARVDFGIALKVAENVTGNLYYAGTYTINDGADGTQTQKDEAIYVKFLGWNVTSTTGTSRLIKAINPAWENTEIMGNNGLLWTTADYHRSFWAINPENVEIQYGNFGEVTGEDLPTVTPTGQFANSLTIPTGTNFTTTYLQENANPYLIGTNRSITAAAPANPSKVIIAAQLVDKSGNPITICEWGYNKYTLPGLKNQIAKALPNLYFKTTTDEGTDAWSQIESDMITFTTEDPLGDTVDDKDYYVYAILDPTTTAGKTWALKSGDTFTEFSSQNTDVSVTTLVNKYIRGIVNHAMIWNSGLTYYFFDIRHLGASAEDVGYVGIVRNHLYRTTVKTLKGLGTPVYDPTLEIYPEVTNPEETVISAEINILSWRLVTTQYDLNWE